MAVRDLCGRNFCVYGVFSFFSEGILWVWLSHWLRDFFLLAVIRLDAYTRKLPYYILSVQPVVAEDKTGVFTKLGYFLNKKLEGRQEHEKI